MDTLLVLLAAGLLPLAAPPPAAATCVLDSDFGFVLNCGFRKSGLFRVRNLGGVKGYVGLGFSVGDELRFNESLSNVEPSSRRRSASARSSGAGPSSDDVTATGAVAALPLKNERRRPQMLRQLSPTVPPFKPIPPPATTPSTAPMVAIVAPGPGGALRVVAPPSASSAPAAAASVSRPSRLAPAPPPPMPPPPPPPSATARVVTVPPFVTLPPTVQKAGFPAAPVVHTLHAPPRMTPPRAAAPPPSHPVPPVAFRQALNAATHHFQVRKDVLMDPDVASNLLTSGGVHAVLPTVPPRSPPRRAAAVPTVVPNPATASPVPAVPIAASAASLVAAATAPAAANITVAEAVALATAIQRLAHAANVSAEALAAALAARRQQNIAALAAAAAAEQDMMEPVPAPVPATVATATVPPPPSTTRHPLASISKVMNAPREYYPVGYDKNFDDNFASRVELPDTPFHCGEQKHFPGLYADEDLGCMVFHVCALTDHGLIMKSFLCPESTLFDQTILKCNWWFYVDCKASKKLYDSNIPISKSYQLMKALAFFSAYNKS